MLYLLTIRSSQVLDFISQSQIQEVLLWLKHNAHLLIVTSVYETSGKYNQLHYHAIVDTQHNFSYRPFTAWGQKDKTKNTFQLHWKQITNLCGAFNYLKKDLYFNSQEEILIQNIYKHNYFNQTTQTFVPSTMLCGISGNELKR